MNKDNSKVKDIQIKAKCDISAEILKKIGAHRIATTQQIDKYYSNTNSLKGDIIRIREEGGNKYITIKREKKKKDFFFRDLQQVFLDNREIEKFITEKNLKLIGTVSKTRNIYKLGKLTIYIDDVQGLGSFIEIHIDNKEDLKLIRNILKSLLIREDSIISHNYIEMIVWKDKNKILKFLRDISDKTKNFAFGITSGVMTTLGVIIGVWFGTKDRLSVLSGIFSIAAADSFSDAMAMYTEEKMEYGSSEATSLKKAMLTFLSKSIISLTFVIPFILFSDNNLKFAVMADFLWGSFLISIFAVQIAAIEYSSTLKKILKQIFLAIIIIILALIGGKVVKSISNFLSQ